MVVQRSCKAKVGGSNPSSGTMFPISAAALYQPFQYQEQGQADRGQNHQGCEHQFRLAAPIGQQDQMPKPL